MTQVVRKIAKEQEGVVLIEALLALPVLTLLTFGILEFGNMMWQRQQLQVGIRDAARYWSRCQPTFHSCSQAKARNIAFYGNPAGTGGVRIPGWDEASGLTITPATPPTSPTPADIVTVSGTMTYEGSPFFGFLLGSSVTIGTYTTMRYLGT
ncbi:MAG: pilus assembly protein [Paracoccaceae bacterium]